MLIVDPPSRRAVTHRSPLTGNPDEPANDHHVRYDLEQLGSVRTRLPLPHGNSPPREAADAMIENGWRPMLADLERAVEEG